jgi:fatty-acyl-CoA synthase
LLPTPTDHPLPIRTSGFQSLAHALDYAASGKTGANFYGSRGELQTVLAYSELRERARSVALRLHGLGFARGTPMALVADTHPDFLVAFFACQYAGLVPVPLPAAVHLGGHAAFVSHLGNILGDSRAPIAFAPPSLVDFLTEASAGLGLRLTGTLAEFEQLPAAPALPDLPAPTDLAYLQYTSGSTRFPRGTMITQHAVLNNLTAILQYGAQVRRGDRFTSWLPYYHDMGLIGLILGPLLCQMSVDYLSPRDFAMRPRLWLNLISQNRATVAFSPPFGYMLCARRVRASDLEQLDLSSWRLAGVGAEMINADWLQRFADALAPAGFRSSAFAPCYGMAECSLAISFAPLGSGCHVDRRHPDTLALEGSASALAIDGSGQPVSSLVNCGRLLPGFEMDIRDVTGRSVEEGRNGVIHLRGQSLMIGYAGNPEATREVLSEDGWLNTGDLGYKDGDFLYITGRAKDLLIINGRNILPQDLELLAEEQPEVRPEDAAAFCIADADGGDVAVLVIQCREQNPAKQFDLITRLKQRVQAEFGIACIIDLVPLHTLPRTSSGKRSRSGARLQFLQRHRHADHANGAPSVNQKTA